MAFTITDGETDRLVREVAELTGESLPEAVTNALRDQLERLRREKARPRLVDELNEIAERCVRLPVHDRRTPEQILGYDEHGLPV